tara:strand:- start:970 stop:2895 length:1926 start_codon:yes stop_codon:yes gene_type:complete
MQNQDQLNIEDVYEGNNSKREVTFIKNYIFWIDKIDSGSLQRNSIFVRPFQQDDSVSQNLLGANYFIQSFFHGYGGRSYQCLEIDEHIILIWFDQLSKSLWSQIFELNPNSSISNKEYFLSKKPNKLTESCGYNIDASFVIINKNLIVGILEKNNKDYLFSLDLNKTNQQFKYLREYEYFAGYLSSNLFNQKISWLEWRKPNMPWDNNILMFGEINDFGELVSINEFKHETINQTKKVSFFHPKWISNSELVVAEDSSGWWNLLFLKIDNFNKITISKKIIRKFVEFGLPQWVSGLSIFSGTKENLFCLSKKNTCWNLEHYKNLSFHKVIRLPYIKLSDLHSVAYKLIFKASSFSSSEELIELDLAKPDNFKNYFPKKDLSFVSNPESFWFNGFNNKNTHSWLYKPSIKRFEKPPLIIKAHSGPTSYFDGCLNKEVQFWLSRGWLVAEVNYGGSSGFGREYRERLNSNWGVVDSYDCIALAKELIRSDLVDTSKTAIFGNSAGGFTALTTLYECEIFKLAICKYPVTNLKDMHSNTHRFEKDYLNSLIGDYELHPDKYFERSPVNNLEKIRQPILLFQGKKDSVIPYQQTSIFYKKLSSQNSNSKLVLFDNEGHGFKRTHTKKDVLRITEQFLNKHILFKN